LESSQIWLAGTAWNTVWDKTHADSNSALSASIGGSGHIGEPNRLESGSRNRLGCSTQPSSAI